MTDNQTIVMVVPSITKLLTSEDFRIGRIGSAEIISVRTNLMGSMRTYTKAQLDNHACVIEASDTISSNVSIAAPFQITYGSNQTAEGTLLKMNIPMFTNLEPDAANELAASPMYPMEVRQNLTVTEIPTGGTLLYNDSPVSVGDTVRLDSNLTFEPDGYMGGVYDYDNQRPIPRRLGVSVTYHGSTYDVAGQTFTVPIYPQRLYEMSPSDTKYRYNNQYYGFATANFIPWASYARLNIYIDELPSNAGTLYTGTGSSRQPVVANDLIPYGASISWKSALPPTANYWQDLKYHYVDSIVNGELLEVAGVGVGHFNVLVDGPSMYTHTFSIPECQSDGTPWPHGTEVGALDYAAAQPVTASIVTSGSPFAVSGDVLIVDDGSQLDYEAKPTWIIKARVTDQYGQYREANQTISITDVNEQPSFSDLKSEYNVSENKASYTTFGTFYVYDDNPSQVTATISGSLAGSELGSEGYDLSDIIDIDIQSNNYNRATMAFRVKNRNLLDYERLYNVAHRNASYPATITAGDGTSTVSTTTMITFLDINEGPIVMDDQTFSFPDRTSNATIQPAGTIVGQVIASDPDIYNKSFSDLTYRITAQDGNVFGIDRDYGVIYIVDGSGLAAGQTYEITVMADDGDFSKSATMTINITRGGRIITWNGKLIRPSNHTAILRV